MQMRGGAAVVSETRSFLCGGGVHLPLARWHHGMVHLEALSGEVHAVFVVLPNNSGGALPVLVLVGAHALFSAGAGAGAGTLALSRAAPAPTLAVWARWATEKKVMARHTTQFNNIHSASPFTWSSTPPSPPGRAWPTCRETRKEGGGGGVGGGGREQAGKAGNVAQQALTSRQ